MRSSQENVDSMSKMISLIELFVNSIMKLLGGLEDRSSGSKEI